MDKKIADMLYYFLIAVVVGTCLFVMYYFFTNGKTCLADPLEYYMANTGNQCWCSGKINIPIIP